MSSRLYLDLAKIAENVWSYFRVAKRVLVPLEPELSEPSIRSS
jgi:hypothetical protein